MERNDIGERIGPVAQVQQQHQQMNNLTQSQCSSSSSILSQCSSQLVSPSSSTSILSPSSVAHNTSPPSSLTNCPPNATSSTQQQATCPPLIYRSPKHCRLAFERINEMRNDNCLCDVTLVVANNRVNAHRLVLASSSNYFKAMFTSEMAESRQQEIQMVDIGYSTLKTLVDFCYTGEITIADVNVQSILPAACLLQLSEIQVHDSFFNTHACRDLMRIADKFAHHNFQDVAASEEFLLLPVNQLIDIISSEELNVRSEETVFAAVMAWIRYDLIKRRPLLSKVLEHVRLPLCQAKFLVSTVSEDPLVKSDARCRDLVDEAKNYLLLPLERPSMQGPRTRSRKPVRYGEVLYAVGGWCSGDAIASVERMDSRTGEWRCVSAMSKRRCGVGVAALNHLLYAVGGHDGQSYLNSVERYDPATNQWSSDVAPTSTCRTSVGVAVLDGLLYAVGGQDGVSCLNVVERYDAHRNEWSKVAPMSTRRLGVSVSVLNGCLYAVGGSDGQTPLNTVERYDPRMNKWMMVKPMGTRRKHLGTAVYNGFLYAVGGRDDVCELSSAERYYAGTNEWVGLAVVNGQLYAVGGFDGTTYLKTVEVYDRELNQWRQSGCMTYRRLGGGVGVVRLANDHTLPSSNSFVPDIPPFGDASNRD
ncbi:unnamed protein product [Anisakis simplex]|uniref:Kelch-like protein 20 (inferred by orthology to a human protein) n=1 Tax=Anisakis simplex TaxID=6269 RepID=A0A0M3JXB1_ANISI|nr:unnamed protein product [Anisakis simplex]